MGLREEKKEATRAAITATSLALFRDRGFDRTRVQDVTAELRISEATFFNYFATKQAVLEAIALDLFDDGLAQLEQDMAQSDRSVVDRLVELTGRFAATFDSDRDLLRLLATHTGLFIGAHRIRLQRLHALLSELFAQGQASGEVTDELSAEELAELFMSTTLATFMVAAGAEGAEQSVGERLRRAVQILLRGCVPADASLEAAS